MDERTQNSPAQEIAQPEHHLFIIWEAGRSQEARILTDLARTFQIVSVHEAHWSSDSVSENFSRFYGQKLPPGSFKEEHCGRGPFLIALVLDNQPSYDKRQTSKGERTVNTNTFDAKQRYRDWTGGGHRIHATDDQNETRHDFAMLFGQALKDFVAHRREPWNGNFESWNQDLVGAQGWADLRQLFSILNETTRYVVLRNFEWLPDQFKTEQHGDIDLLGESAEDLAFIVNARKVFPEPHRVHYAATISGQEVLFDFRFVGDDYYDCAWEKELLASRVLNAGGFYTPNAEGYFYSLLYHALAHKPKIAADYIEKLARLAAELKLPGVTAAGLASANEAKRWLDIFLSLKGFNFTCPADLSVHFSQTVLNQPRHLIEAEAVQAFSSVAPATSLMSARFLADHEGTRYFSVVAKDNGSIIKHTTGDLAWRDAQLLKRLDGIHFPRVLDSQRTEHSSMARFECVDGCDLTEVIPQIAASPAALAKFFGECFEILKSLQAAGITHRDIQTHNLLVRDGHPVLIDFGWATSSDLPSFNPSGLGDHGRPPNGEFCDAFSFGKVFAQCAPSNSTVFAPLIKAMTEADSHQRVTDVSLLQKLLGDLALPEHWPATPVFEKPRRHMEPAPWLGKAAVILERASGFAANKDFDSARQLLNAAILGQAESSELAVALAGVLLELNRAPEALRVLQNFLHRVPNDLPARKLFAGLLMQADDLPAAAKNYWIVMQKEPNDLETTLMLGACFFRIGDSSAAKTLFQRALELDPRNETARENLAFIAASAKASESQTAKPVAAKLNSTSEIAVSIIIPVYGQLKFTTECLEAIRRHTSGAYEVIVVDDASDDGTHEFLKQAARFYPEVRGIRRDTNGGFSQACNSGAVVARGEYLVFLNNDTQPCAGWLDALLNTFAQDPTVGIAGSLLLFPRRTENETEPDRVQHCGIVFNSRQEALHLYKFCLASQPFVQQTREYQAVTAACLMIPRQLFNEVGGFGTEYLNGAEDLDLCFKVRAVGRKVIGCAESVVRHFESSTLKSGHSWSNANYKLFLQRWSDRIKPDEQTFYAQDGVAASGSFKIAMVTPLRPLKTGVADYVEELLPALSQRARVDFFVDDLTPSNSEVMRHHLVHSLHDLTGAHWTYHYDAIVYHIGNNRFHGEIYKLAANCPGIVVLHEYDCRGCGEEPSSRRHLRSLLNRAKAVIVHNEHSRRLLHQEFPTLPCSVIPHLLSDKALQTDAPEKARQRVGLPQEAFVIVSLGLIQLHKRNHITVEAFARFAKRHPQSLLVLAGEAPDPNFRALLHKRIQEESLQNRVRITGWVSDEQFFDYLSAADVTVNLRYPARGEESGSLTRILGCGKPAIVSNYAQFADIPDECVIKLNFDNEVEDLIAAWEQLLNPAEREKRATPARNYYRTRNNVQQVAALYAETCREAGKFTEATLQLRQPRYQFEHARRARILWQAPVFSAKDISRSLILALDRLKVPIRVQSTAALDLEATLINPDDRQRIQELTSLEAGDSFIQIYAGRPAQFCRVTGASHAVVLVASHDPSEIRAWIKTGADEFWAHSETIRKALIAAGVPEAKVAVVPPGISALSYGATVNELRPNGLFRFFCVTDWSPGSGWETVLRAFLREFKNPAEAQLIFKCALTHLPTEQKMALYQQTLTRFLRENPEFTQEHFRLVNGDLQCRTEDIMPSFYAAGSALVQASLNGSGARAVIEAFAIGLPVITTETVRAGHEAICQYASIVRTTVKQNRPAADETHLRQLMRQLVRERLSSQLPAMKARQHCLAELTWEKIAQHAATRLANLLEADEARVAPVDKPGSVEKVEAASISHRQIRWQSPVFDPSGYADEARYLIRNTHAHVPIRLESIGRLSKQFREAMDPAERAELETLMAKPLAKEFIQLTIAPAYALRRDPQARYAIGRTTFETDRLAPDWVAACNGMDEIWVPSEFNVETFRRAGVTVPIHIVPQGVDGDRFHPGLKPLPIEGRRQFAFLSIFEWIHRKGWDVLLRAWAEAYRADDDVCLMIRSYLPNVTEGGTSTVAINEHINRFLEKELGRSRGSVAPIIVLGEQLAQLDMPRLYASADAFVLPTRGEGWGRPYIEAMACGLPVIGTRWSAQLAFMNERNSFLIDIEGLETVDERMEFKAYRGHQWARPSASHLKELLRRVSSDPTAARKVGELAAAEVRTKWNWYAAAALAQARLSAINQQLDSAAAGSPSPAASAPKLIVSWEGSFLDFGSLSHVNRELTAPLENIPVLRLNRVNTSAESQQSVFKPLARKLSRTAPADVQVTIRHAWPPNWSRPKSGKLVVIQPWEFGSLPVDWVTNARNVDEFWVPTEAVRKFYTESGIDAAKVHVVPNGIDAEVFRPDAAPLALATKKKFRFLFVGGTIGRKGPDVLLNAYLKSFTAADDVCLVIKDFGGQSVYRGQTFAKQIKKAQSLPNAPEILYLDSELEPKDLPGLYTACHCLVHPYRGEGFGLPVLEAMACGLPVVVTGGGATDDFATDEFAYRLPSTRRALGREISGMKLVSEGWLLEPNTNALAERLKWIVANTAAAQAKGLAASEHARKNWTWKKAAAIAAARLIELPGAILESTPAQPSVKPAGVQLPPCATLGNLSKAREQFGRKDFAAAWNSTREAISERPFHPEAYLLLAEISLAAGDGSTARLCAQRARDLAPGWKSAKQFLKKAEGGKRESGNAELLAKIKADISHITHHASRLSICLITKNEEKFIAQCLKSIQGLAQQIVVVDTGSTDRTIEIAQAHGAEVHTFTWCDDFSAARNAALEHATGDWILMLDADEELPAEQHAKLQADMKKTDAIAYRLPLVNEGQNDGRSFVPRLFRNAPGVHFYGRIHEQVFPSLVPFCKVWGMETRLGTAELLHHGYTREMVKDRNKNERNLRLLKQAIAERPTDTNLVMNLGLELVRSGELSEGLAQYAEAFRLMSAQPVADVVPELREVLLTQYTVHLYKNRQHDDVLRILNSPLAKNGGLTASLHFALGLANFELKDYRTAAEQMRQCLARRYQPALSPINTDILTAAPQHCLALSLAQLGEAAGAEKAFETALKEKGRLENVKLDYAKFLAQQNRPVDALHKLHEAVGENPANINAWKLGAEIALQSPEFLEFACDWTGEAIQALPDDPAIIAYRAEALLLSQQTSHARPLWERACNCVRPPNALAALILCATVESETIPPTRDAAEETATSKAFVGWYQRLASAGAEQTLVKLNSRVDALRNSLPTAARLLDTALHEAK